MDTHTFCNLDKYILQSRPKMEEVCTPPLPNQNWACILFRQIHFAEIYFKFWKNTFCNLDQTKCGRGVPSTTAQWELSSATAGGVPHSHNLLLLRYLIFLICLSGGCLLRMPKSTYLKWILCFFKPSVLLMAHVSQIIERVFQIRFWKGTKLGVKFHTCDITTFLCNAQF